ncbi:MAG TPA: hypothetical protein VFS39_16620 [Nitrospira sp.]|nr:hypothetical protein [Nitrospira sp.]
MHRSFSRSLNGVSVLFLLSLLLPPPGCNATPAPSPAPESHEGGEPELPREYVDTAPVAPTGKTYRLKAGDELQEALELAQPGDVIVLEAGATYKGPFTLPNKTGGSGWITIKTSGLDRLPQAGTRVTPAHAPDMPKLTSRRGGGVLIADKGAHHYRLVGLEIAPEEGQFLYSLLWLGNNKERSLEEQPHHIIVDRCFLHGDPRKGSRRGVAFNGRHLAVIDSHLSDFKEAGADSQAILGWSGSGPFKIVNNYLEGAAENVAFGGVDPVIPGLVPSDIEIRHNDMKKPLAWKRGEAEYDGSSWMIKNLFELKNARRVLIDGNVLEHSWEESQSGFAVLFTVRNQDGKAPWSTIQDVRFTNNIVRHSGSGITLMAHDNNRDRQQSTKMQRILVKNNVWEDIGGPRWGGMGILFQLREGTADVAIEHNSGMQTGFLVHAEGPEHRGFRFVGNVAPHNESGIVGRGVGMGTQALNALFPHAVVTGNLFGGGDERLYPPGNRFLKSVDAIPFVNIRAGDCRLARAKDQSQGQGDQAAGVDIGLLCHALGPLRAHEPMCRPSSLEAHGEPAHRQ